MQELGIIETLVRTGTFVLGIGVFIATFFTRRIVNTAFPHLKPRARDVDAASMYSTTFARWWNSVILYAVPVVYGGAFGFSQSEYIFGPMKESLFVCVMFGCGVGWFASFLYKGIRKALAVKLGVSADALPPAGD